MIDTRRTRRVPGRGFRVWFAGCRVASGWSAARAHSGHVAQPEASGENSLGTRVHSAFGLPGGIRESRDTWRLGGLPEERFSLGTRRQMANSGDIRGKSSRCGVFGDTWQLGKNPGGEGFRSALGTRGGFQGRFEEGPKGFFRRRVERGFRRNGFGLTSGTRSEEHTSELQSRVDLVCRLLLEKKKKKYEVV